MLKKTLAAVLALVLMVSAAPLAGAKLFDDGWRIFIADGPDENTFDIVILAPAKYTRLGDAPQVETVLTTDREERSFSTPAAAQIQYCADGKTETRWALTVTCTAPDESVEEYLFTFAVTAGSLLDDAGNGNERVYFGDEDDYRSAEGYTEVDVFSRLLLHDYGDIEETVAVGDTVHLEYNGLYPVEILVNGVSRASFPGGEKQKFTCDVTETGTLNVVVRQNGAELASRTVNVITAEEMYERNLNDTIPRPEDIPTIEDLTQPGVPIGNAFFPFAMIVTFIQNVVSFFHRLFSFVRIPN
jgi:hypothetical protein